MPRNLPTTAPRPRPTAPPARPTYPTRHRPPLRPRLRPAQPVDMSLPRSPLRPRLRPAQMGSRLNHDLPHPHHDSPRHPYLPLGSTHLNRTRRRAHSHLKRPNAYQHQYLSSRYALSILNRFLFHRVYSALIRHLILLLAVSIIYTSIATAGQYTPVMTIIICALSVALLGVQQLLTHSHDRSHTMTEQRSSLSLWPPIATNLP
jgi:hypothetical protein